MFAGGKLDHCQKNKNGIYLLSIQMGGKKKKQWKNIHNFKEIITLISVYVAGELYSIPSQTNSQL